MGVLAVCRFSIPGFEHPSLTRLPSSFCKIMVADRSALLAALTQRPSSLRSSDKKGEALTLIRLSEMAYSMQPHEVERRHEVAQSVDGAKRAIGKKGIVRSTLREVSRRLEKLAAKHYLWSLHSICTWHAHGGRFRPITMQLEPVLLW